MLSTDADERSRYTLSKNYQSGGMPSGQFFGEVTVF
jgi:hypothetical protein